MPHVNEHTFGPGSYESLLLKTWVSKVDGKLKRFNARLEGTYTIYCGNGWEHDKKIDITESAWSNEVTGREIAYAHETDVKLDFASSLIDWALEDWSDPCEETEL